MAISREWRKGLVLGLVAGVLCAAAGLAPGVWSLEERFGLPLLYGLRGERAPPAEVLVIGMDAASAEALGLASLHDRWPRSIHARLVERLAAAQPAVIVFDVFFRDGRAPHTTRLAQAFRTAGNVVLFSYADAAVAHPMGDAVSQVRIVPPARSLADAALGTAPFVLPKSPHGVLHYWAFHPAAGDAASLPVVAWHGLALDEPGAMAERLGRQCRGGGPDPPPCRAAAAAGLDCAVARLRRSVRDGGPCLDTVGAPGPLMERLRRVHDGPGRRYLNFYGPAGTVPTLSYHQALHRLDTLPEDRSRQLFGDKVVLVGHAEVSRWEQRDAFVTVYSDPVRGVDLPGVEIAATAVGNLIDGSALRPLPGPAGAVVLLLWGVLIGVVARGLRVSVAAPLAAAAAGAWLAAAGVLFAAVHLWLPLVVPLGLGLPLTLAAGLAWRYGDARRERRALERAASLYLPAEVVGRMTSPRHDPGTVRRTTRGVCLATDVADYTTLAEGLGSEALGDLMGAYFAEVFTPVRGYGGLISDIKGDAMLALWTHEPGAPDPRSRAAAAALEIVLRVDRFNRSSPHPLPTRIGLHYGELLLGGVGGGDHYEYRPVGDTVNTASRIEDANKALGTRVLASAAFAGALGEGVAARRLGRFLLRGKSRPLELVELLPPGAPEVADDGRRAAFASALGELEAGRRDAALEAFAGLADRYGDGPARFYASYLARPPAGEPPGRGEPVCLP